MDNMQNNQFNQQDKFNQDNYNTQQCNNTQINSGSIPKFTFYLVMGILQLMCCNQITGIITIVFDVMASSDYKIGNFIGYEQKIKACKIATIIGIILSAIIYLLMLFIYGIAIISELTNY